MLGDRYKVSNISGKGVFGSVIKAIDLETLKEVAIKIIRKGDTYEMSGEREISILTMLNSCDPNGIISEEIKWASCSCIRNSSIRSICVWYWNHWKWI
jgi:serine/threonine protein kinase